jgi:CopG family transcriptional regulator, nickel-responsive regulator
MKFDWKHHTGAGRGGKGGTVQRVTITMEDELLAELDALVARRGYQNRSEALRDLARAGLRRAEPPVPQAPCVAALVYVYDHARRDLPNRLTHEFHDHHDLAVSTLHVHLDRGQCLEVAVLRGATGAVQHMADHVIAERGVRHGQLVLLPSAPDEPAPPGHG